MCAKHQRQLPFRQLPFPNIPTTSHSGCVSLPCRSPYLQVPVLGPSPVSDRGRDSLAVELSHPGLLSPSGAPDEAEVGPS